MLSGFQLTEWTGPVFFFLIFFLFQDILESSSNDRPPYPDPTSLLKGQHSFLLTTQLGLGAS